MEDASPRPQFGKITTDTHHIKFREHGEKRYLFLDSSGAGSRLKIHALRYTTENAQKTLDSLAQENPTFEFIGVDAASGKRTLLPQRNQPQSAAS